jgi:hypothetical protein
VKLGIEGIYLNIIKERCNKLHIKWGKTKTIFSKVSTEASEYSLHYYSTSFGISS